MFPVTTTSRPSPSSIAVAGRILVLLPRVGSHLGRVAAAELVGHAPMGVQSRVRRCQSDRSDAGSVSPASTLLNQDGNDSLPS